MTAPRIVPVAPGEDLRAALAALAPDTWAQGVGHVEGVEIRLPGEDADVNRPLRGRFTLVSLAGASGGPFTVTLARATDTGVELVGGVLLRARSAGVLLALHEPAPPAERTAEAPAREVVPQGNPPPPAAAPAAPPAPTPPKPAPAPAAQSAQPAAIALPPAPLPPAPPPPAPPPPAPAPSASAAAPAPAPTPASAPVAATPTPLLHTPPPAPAIPPKTWEDVVVASDDGELIGEDGEPVPQPGDLVDHFSFGVCEVLMCDGERLRMRDLKGANRVREVSLEALRVMSPSTTDGKRTFRLLRRLLPQGNTDRAAARRRHARVNRPSARPRSLPRGSP
jgi:hypothetical protein